MLYLKKMFLVNWHYISQPTVFDFDREVTFITGTNAAGKSTVLDAIQTVLVCKTTSYNLSNTLSGERSGRDLMGYMRAATEEGGYKRKGAVTTHLAAQMCYENGQTAFTLGCTFYITDDSTSRDKINKRWWKTDAGIDDIPFVREKGRISQWDTFSRSGLPGFKDYQTKEAAGADFSRFLGLTKAIDGDKAKLDALQKVLNKMIAFNPKEMKNIDDVLKKHVFEDRKIDIGSLLETLDEQMNLKGDVLDLENRLTLLSKMVTKDDRFAQCGSEAAKANVMILLSSIERKRDDIRKKRANVRELSDSIANLDMQKAGLEDRKNILDDLIASIKAKNSDSALEREIEKIKEKITRAEDAGRTIRQSAGDLSELVKRSCETGMSDMLDMDAAQDLADVTRIPEYGDYDTCRKLCASSDALRKEADRKRGVLAGTVNGLREKAKALRTETESLRKNNYVPAGRNAALLLDAIRRAARGREQEIVYLHEKLICQSEEWQQAIESALGGARFHIWVPAGLYETAAKVTRDLRKNGVDIQGAVMLDTRDLMERKTPDRSICSVLTSEDEEVVKYLTYAYGNIVMEEDASRVPPESRYIHIDKMLLCHSKRRLSVMKKEPCIIGEEAKRRLLKKKEEELENVLSDISLAERTVRQLEDLSEAVFTYMRNAPKEEDYKEASSLRIYMDTQRDLLHKRDTLLSKDEKDQLASSEREREDIIVRLKDIDREKSDRNIRLGNAKSSVENDENDTERLQADLDGYAPLPEYEEFVKGYREERRSQPPAKIRTDAENVLESIRKEKEMLEGDLRSLQREYCRLYTRSDREGVASMPIYREEYERIRVSELPEVKKKLEASLENSRTQFKKTVLSSWKDSFRRCRRLINEVNSVLGKTPYIGRYYRLGKLRPADGQEDIYRAITNAREDDGTFNIADADDESFSLNEDAQEKANAVLDDMIMSLLQSSVSDKDTEKWLDYRRYVKFSFEMTLDPEGKWTNVEDTLSLNSGGELQVPFYLIFCSALVTIYGMNRRSTGDCIRIMMLDEAFDHMDGPNTARAIELFSKQLGMQLVFCAPSERYEQMGENVRMVLLMKGDRKKKVRTGENFSYAECAEILEGA